MRGTRDALRSVGRYLDLVLNDGPPTLGEVFWRPPGGTKVYRWTHGGRVAGCLEVSEDAWTWLKLSSRGPEVAVVSGGRRWAESGLVWDPTADLGTVGLPTGGTVVTGSSLPLEGDPWEVRFWGERGEITEPFCRVQLIAGAGTSGPSLYYELSQPMAIECYPKRADHPEQAIDQAAAVQDVLVEAFRGRGVDEGRPRRVPLYDYEGISLEQGVTSTRIDSDFLRVLDFSPRLLPDLVDPRRVACVADVRFGWRKAVRQEELPRRPSPIGTPPASGGVVTVGHVRGDHPVESVKVQVDGS